MGLPGMDSQLLERIHEDILRAYTSFNEPSFRFTQVALRDRPYENIVQQLKKIVELKEWTYPDYDVSFHYATLEDAPLSEGSADVRLSMVGPYAMLQRGRPVTKVVTLTNGNLTKDLDRKILECLEANNFIVLDKTILETSVPLAMIDTDKEVCNVYQALFTDWDIIPWWPEHIYHNHG